MVANLRHVVCINAFSRNAKTKTKKTNKQRDDKFQEVCRIFVRLLFLILTFLHCQLPGTP